LTGPKTTTCRTMTPCFTFALQRWVLPLSSFSQSCCCHTNVCQRKTTQPFGQIWLKPLQVLTSSWELTASTGTPGGWSSSSWQPGLKRHVFHPGFSCIGTVVTHQLFVTKLLQATVLSPSSLSLAFTSQHLLSCGDDLHCSSRTCLTVQGQQLYWGFQSNLCAVPSTQLLQKENNPFDSPYATT